MKTATQALLFIIIALITASSLYAQGPVANFSYSPTTACAPAAIIFTNTSTGATSYAWNLGNGVTTGTTGAGTTYSNPGTYTVTLTAMNGSQSNTKTIQLVISASPTVNFLAQDSSTCPGTPVNFSSIVNLNAPGSGTYYWNFGQGSPASGQNVSYTYNSPGTYQVTLSAISSAGCTTSVTKPQIVNTPPVVAFSASPSGLCAAGGTINFSNTTTGTGPITYYWDFGDGTNAAGATQSHTYNSLGVFTVTLVATDAHGCKDTLVKPSYITVAALVASFTGPSSGCAGSSATFTNTTAGANTSSWNFGDGSSGTSGAHNYSTPGTYTVTLTTSNGACSSTATQQITINAKPVVSFTFQPTSPCPTPVNVSFTNTSTGSNNYNWSFGDGGSSYATSPTYSYSANVNYLLNYTVQLHATNSQGCSDSAHATVTIYPLQLKILTSDTAGCFPFSVSFSAQAYYHDTLSNQNLPYPNAITSYSWNFGDGYSDNTPNPSHTYQTGGTFTVTLTCITANGCTVIKTQIINTGTHPTANFTGTPTTVCVNGAVSFTATLSSGATNYFWDFGDGGIGSGPTLTHIYVYPGIYTVKLIVSNNGCEDSMVRTAYVTVNFPRSIFSTTTVCDTPTKVFFTNNSVGATSFIWFFGDGTSNSTTLSPIHYYPSQAIYYATLVTYNSTTGCHDTAGLLINLLGLQLGILQDDSAKCLGTGPVTYTATVGAGTGGLYTWQFGTGTATVTSNPPNSPTIMHNYPVKGVYTITLTVTNQNGCATTYVCNNCTTIAKPAASFTAPTTGCAPGTTTFVESASCVPGTYIDSMTWTFGDGTPPYTTTNVTTSHTYNNIGFYSIGLKVTDNLGCTDVIYDSSYLQLKHPVASFSAPTNQCVGVPFTFMNSSQGSPLNYYWTFGDGTTGTGITPTHIYQQPGVYTVKLVITDPGGGCGDSMIKLNYITVNVAPHAAFTMSDTFTICPPLVVNFTNQSTGAVQYYWSFGNGPNSFLQNPNNFYTAGGIYNIFLVATNAGGCKDTARGSVRILGYAGAMSYTPLTGCAPLTVQFTAHNLANVPAFVYDFRDGSTLATTDTTVTHTYTTPGPYVPRLIMTDNKGCAATSYGLDTIKVDGIFPGFTFSPYPACDHGTITFIDTSQGAYSTINSHLWIFHDNTTSTLAGPTKTFNGVGTYPVTLITTTTNGCRDTLHTSIVFYGYPSIGAGPDTTICVGDSATLRPSGGATYTWSPGSSLSCTSCTNPYAFPASPTSYVVVGKDIHGCSSTDTMNVLLRTKTIAKAGPDTAICQGIPLQLIATGGTVYAWSPPDALNNPKIADPIALTQTTTHYIVIVKLAGCIPDTAYVDVAINPKPIVNAGPDQTIVAGTFAKLQATGSSFITGYLWSPAESVTCPTCAGTQAQPKTTTDYTIIARTDFDCTDTDVVNIKVICENSQIFMPNTFTPNGNGVNDVFYVHGKGIKDIKSFRIYDRWGEKIFERAAISSDDKSTGWDGTLKGKQLPPDVYVYIVEAVCDTGEDLKWQGNVMLLR